MESYYLGGRSAFERSFWVASGDIQGETSGGHGKILLQSRQNGSPIHHLMYSRLRTAIVFAVVGDHKHNLPFQHVVVHQATTDTRYVFATLHLF